MLDKGLLCREAAQMQPGMGTMTVPKRSTPNRPPVVPRTLTPARRTARFLQCTVVVFQVDRTSTSCKHGGPIFSPDLNDVGQVSVCSKAGVGVFKEE